MLIESLLALALCAAPPDRAGRPQYTLAPEQLATLHVVVEAEPTELQTGDVLFMRLILTNLGKEPLRLPAVFSREWSNVSVKLTDVDRHTSFALLPDGYVCGFEGCEELKPGQKWVLGYDALQVPPLGSVDAPFWKPDTLPDARYALDVSLLFSRYLAPPTDGPFVRPELSQGTRGRFLTIRPRPEAEMGALVDWYRRDMKAEREQVAHWDWNRPLLCGVGRVPLEWSRPEKLAALEEMLSPGSLRDVVHVTRLAAKTYDGETDEEKRIAMGELLRWLDSRPEIERHWLAMQLSSWCWHNKGLGRFGYELMHELIARLPERYGAEPDYRQNVRRQYLLDHPRAAEYWKQADDTR